MDPKKISVLEKHGFNVPKRVIGKKAPFKECSARVFGEIDFEKLKNYKYKISNHKPYFVYYLKPCNLDFADGYVEIYDVTNKDVIASLIIDYKNKYFEGENQGYIRRITREGIKEFYGHFKNYLEINGFIKSDLVYRVIKELIKKNIDGIVEITIHRHKHGVFRKNYIAWEFIPQ
ncbi:NEQ233 [Nanoarchaeum equitans Kin4-M]|uniref:NEQ233 n=1 Tax=Nanoarchaeum equitans (strain Kin4-M) TaxID=228908 RepID=Q74NE1_NANEQ|nr:NEQ233 [Nanoarchaeum equitans Kin4-M]